MEGTPRPPEADDPIDLSPLARVGGDPRIVKRASKLIRWITVAADLAGAWAWRRRESRVEARGFTEQPWDNVVRPMPKNGRTLRFSDHGFEKE
jgi:hypothetical protein